MNRVGMPYAVAIQLVAEWHTFRLEVFDREGSRCHREGFPLSCIGARSQNEHALLVPFSRTSIVIHSFF